MAGKVEGVGMNGDAKLALSLYCVGGTEWLLIS